MALSLDARFNCTTHLLKTKTMLDAAQPSVTFWGIRVVAVAGKEDTVCLDNIAAKAHQSAWKCRNTNNMTDNDRRVGVEIVKKLREFYTLTDAQVETLNYFTQFLVRIREFNLEPYMASYTPRFYIEQITEGIFQHECLADIPYLNA